MAKKDKEIALAISGGGYRSTLFALGSLWRLNEFGLLPRIGCITSVSGGSILSGFLAIKWRELNFDPKTQVATNFKSVIADPIRDFCSKTIDVWAVLGGLIPFIKSMGDRVADMYAQRLYGTKTIQDVVGPPDGPEFIFYATSLQTGDNVRLCKDYISDYKVGKVAKPKLSLAKVVGASSAFPPIFSPVILKHEPSDWQYTKGAFLFRNPIYRKKLILTDGGVYDNMGLEAVWKPGGFKTVFVCDAGAPWHDWPKPCTNWFSQLLRSATIQGDQSSRLRRRTLVENYKEKDQDGEPLKYYGTYWGIQTEINRYEMRDAMTKDNDLTKSLKEVPTRLCKFKPERQGWLINWGYALTDAALRKWYFRKKQKGGKWPVPEYAIS